MIRNIIFDWSGTLVDDLPAVWKATNYVLAQSERAEMSLEQFRAEFCLPFTLFYDKYTPHVPLPQLESWFHSEFRHAQDSVCELPHAREFLEHLVRQPPQPFVSPANQLIPSRHIPGGHTVDQALQLGGGIRGHEGNSRNWERSLRPAA